ncbi:MAG: thioredoxin-dependent thiol peroxidase [Bacteroidota bacterium]
MSSFLNIGSPAPSNSVFNQKGETASLQDYAGKKLIVFVYPKANSGSCTKEAVSLRDNYTELQKAGYEVVGLSPDKEKPLGRFIEKQELPYDLLGDPENELIQALGAWGEKSMYGKTYMGVMRSTFLFDEAGKLTHVIEKVKTKEHGEQILALLAETV